MVKKSSVEVVQKKKKRGWESCGSDAHQCASVTAMGPSGLVAGADRVGSGRADLTRPQPVASVFKLLRNGTP